MTHGSAAGSARRTPPLNPSPALGRPANLPCRRDPLYPRLAVVDSTDPAIRCRSTGTKNITSPAINPTPRRKTRNRQVRTSTKEVVDETAARGGCDLGSPIVGDVLGGIGHPGPRLVDRRRSLPE